MKSIHYHFYKNIKGFTVYQPYANIERKFNICMNTKEQPCVLVVNGEIKNVYVHGRNYQAERHLKKYKENKQLQEVIAELQKEV